MTRPNRLRVVFTGHAGLAKREVIARLCDHIYAQDPAWRGTAPGYRASIEKELARSYEAEARIKPMDAFLELEWREQQRRWRHSIQRAISACERDNPQYAFLSFHLSYQWHSGFFSPLSWRVPIWSDEEEKMEDSLLYFIRDRFQPDYCVTLIDDIQAVQQRIAPGIHIRLRELLTWRNFEILLTDFLAKESILTLNYKTPNPLFSPPTPNTLTE